MGKWRLFKNERDFLSLVHLNLLTGRVSDCGELRLDTPEQMVIDWIMHTDAVRPGDVIQFPTRTLTVAREARA